jgi:ribosomal protein L24
VYLRREAQGGVIGGIVEGVQHFAHAGRRQRPPMGRIARESHPVHVAKLRPLEKVAVPNATKIHRQAA